MARRDDREYWAYLREEQRSQPGCAARELCRVSLFRDTSLAPTAASVHAAAHSTVRFAEMVPTWAIIGPLTGRDCVLRDATIASTLPGRCRA